MARIIVGVCGGIAAYKMVSVVRGLVQDGHQVTVIPTPSALRMVGAPTWEALAGHPVATDTFADAHAVAHVAAARDADLVVCGPATANTMAKLAAGLADNLLTSTILASTAPLVLFPAMHTQMWAHPATQANVATLRSRGVEVVTPAVGALSSGDFGPGRFPEPEDVLAIITQHLGRSGRLSGRRVVISAGGTREAIDPVRFIGNRSSGRFGCEIAAAAARAGADVTLVASNVSPQLYPAGVRVVPAPTADDVFDAMHAEAPGADLLIMTAAIADYKPARARDAKIKKEGDAQAALTLELIPTRDVLASLVQQRRDGQMIVGFAAETGDHRSFEQLGREKARRKGADLLAINQVGHAAGFGDVDTAVTLVDAAGDTVAQWEGTKRVIADRLIEACADRLAHTTK